MTLSEKIHFQSQTLAFAALTAAVVQADKEFTKDTL